MTTTNTAAAFADYQVEAYNTAKDSENKIHDDTVAKKFGFSGGLVPGVDIYAYMTHPAVARWGQDWLARGTADCRFIKPVYEGAMATISAEAIPHHTNSMAIRVESAGQLCAEGTVGMPNDAAPVPDLTSYKVAPLPDERPPAAPGSLPEGALLGTYEINCDGATEAAYQGDVREDLPLYAAENLIHPGHLLRFGNWALTQNVVLGPWIHVGSKVQHFATAHHDADISIRAKVVKNYERKGHLFVELDALVLAQGTRPLAHIEHTAIYQPRQVTEG
ncbi:MAG: hypothetical protein HOK21_17205 [Rhodospirillaceae bacterium]|jgi:hypothetical protein|nr:hypothetical protein [Rhodospirillaceae bacterium]MBT4689274.1 hypothetical protein [Rhodospirillaceae bacterium]MBT5079347.1 hypothetical protein [Rhodospirillaceae bacterium]MBT5525823.1 hypothetical protein [Rhodospirillaceae bacterium]MBT5880194.1 hypothetical protein [Rhodospirillaceae bacterium]